MINAHCYALMMKMLMEDDVSRSKIKQETGLHQVTVSRYIDQLHKVGVVYISSWERDARGKCWVPHYALNLDGLKDAKKPKGMTTAQRSARFRKKRSEIRFINSISEQIRTP